MIEKIENFLDDNFNRGNIIFLSVISFIFVILRLPSVSEPYWYGDEGIYEVIGMALRSGRILYSQIWDNKPPLLYIIYAIFNGDQFYARLLSVIFGLLSVVVFFAVAKKLFKNVSAVYISSSVFVVLFGLPLIEGNIANAENFMLLPILIAFYLLFCIKSKSGFFLAGLAGVVLSFAFLTKIVAIFDFAAFSVILLSLRFFETVSLKKDKISKELASLVVGIEKEIIFGAFFAVPVIFTVLYFVFNNAFSDFFRAVFSQNVGYVNYGNFFIFPGGLLYLKLFLLISGVMIIFRYRKTLTRSGLIIFMWLIFALFDAFFSSRPYTHYLLVLLPAFSLFIGYILEDKKLLKFTGPVLLVILLLVHLNFGLYTKIIPYYKNYIGFIGGGSIASYQNFFDSNVTRDNDLAQFVRINTRPSDNIFLWGDDAQIYALSGKLPPGRYTVSYHITFYQNAIEETQSSLRVAKPKYIIQIKDDKTIDNFLDGYTLRYKIDNANIYERQS